MKIFVFAGYLLCCFLAMAQEKKELEFLKMDCCQLSEAYDTANHSMFGNTAIQMQKVMYLKYLSLKEKPSVFPEAKFFVVTIKDLGFSYWVTFDVLKASLETKSYRLVPPEAAILIRNRYRTQPKGEELFVMSEPVRIGHSDFLFKITNVMGTYHLFGEPVGFFRHTDKIIVTKK